MAIWIDVSGDSNVHVSFTGLYFNLYHYQPDGSVITYSSINLWGMEEQFAFSYGEGPYQNDVFMTYGEEQYNVYSTTWFYHYDDTDYDFLGNTTHHVTYPNYFGCMMVAMHQADGVVSGAGSVTGSMLRPLFQIIKPAPGSKVASSCMILEVEDRRFGADGVLFMGDCGVIPDPSVEQLAEIAVSTAQLAHHLLSIRPVGGSARDHRGEL